MKNNPAKQNIINVSKKLFYYQGYKKTFLNQIAKEAKMSKSNIFTYYKSKSEIMYSVYEQYHAYMDKVAEDSLVGTTTLLTYHLFFIIINHNMFLFDDNFSELYSEIYKEIMIEEISFKAAYPIYMDIAKKYISDNIDKATLELNFYTTHVISSDFLIKMKKGLISISSDQIKNNTIELFTKSMKIDKEILEESIKEAEIFANKFNYNKLSEFWYKDN